MSKKILVTGGCGFIGSHFIDAALKKKKYKIINIDKLTYASNYEYTKIQNINYTFYKGDITNTKLLKKIIVKHKPNYIFNFAAESHVDNSIKHPKLFLNTNIIGTYSILKSIYDLNFLNIVKFIQISTDEVFGDRFNKKPSRENFVYNPSSPYAASKAASDHLVKSWSRTFGLKYLITYSANNFGPRQNKEKLIPKAISNILSNKNIPIYGDGHQKRDWVYVQDNVKAILKIGLSNVVNDSFNIPGNKFISNINLVRKIIKLMRNRIFKNNKKIINPLISYVSDRKGHDKVYKLNPYKTLYYFNLNKKKVTFERAINQTIEYYVKKLT